MYHVKHNLIILVKAAQCLLYASKAQRQIKDVLSNLSEN